MTRREARLPLAGDPDHAEALLSKGRQERSEHRRGVSPAVEVGSGVVAHVATDPQRGVSLVQPDRAPSEVLIALDPPVHLATLVGQQALEVLLELELADRWLRIPGSERAPAAA